MSCTVHVHVVALCLKKISHVKESINNTVLIEQLSNEMNPLKKTYVNWQIYLDPTKMKSVLLINCYWGSSGRAKTSLHFFLPTTLETVISRITLQTNLPTSKHFKGDGIRTSLSFLQSTRIMPIGLCSKMPTACWCSLLYLSNDSEKKETSKFK